MLNQPEVREDHKNIVEQGFTLVELLIVIVILGILAGIVVFAVGNLTQDASKNACQTEASTVEGAFQAYKAHNKGAAPSGADAAAVITTLKGNGGGGPYLTKQPSTFDGAASPANGTFTINITTGVADVSKCTP